MPDFDSEFFIDYSSLDDFCAAEGAVKSEIVQKLASVNYEYSDKENRFI